MIRLAIEITSPLTPDDRDLLSGIAVMTLAIANRELAAQGFPEAFPSEEPEEEQEEKPQEPTQPCGAVLDDTICVGVAGHRGRHKYRPLVSTEGMN